MADRGGIGVRRPLTRDGIVEAARRRVEHDGHEHLSIRQLAGELGVTAPALYDHVRSKDDLLRAVAETGYVLMADVVVDEQARAIDRLRTRAHAYVDFAERHPRLFGLMFAYRPSAIAVEVDNELGAASESFDAAVGDVSEAIADGDLVDRDPVQVGLTIWTAVHGVATVAMVAPPVANAVVDDVIDALFAGLGRD